MIEINTKPCSQSIFFFLFWLQTIINSRDPMSLGLENMRLNLMASCENVFFFSSLSLKYFMRIYVSLKFNPVMFTSTYWFQILHAACFQAIWPANNICWDERCENRDGIQMCGDVTDSAVRRGSEVTCCRTQNRRYVMDIRIHTHTQHRNESEEEHAIWILKCSQTCGANWHKVFW